MFHLKPTPRSRLTRHSFALWFFPLPRLLFLLALLLIPSLLAQTKVKDVRAAGTATADGVHRPVGLDNSSAAGDVLSPFWGPSIQRWSAHIGALADAYGFHPDFIAAVIKHESDGEHRAVSQMGAVGLMGVMPTGPGLEWRPSSEELLTPATNLRWGMAILSYVVQQSGGDLFTALAAYNGGWEQVDSRVPREYAARVLDSYGRALVARSGLSPDMASRWTVAVEIKAGNVPTDSPLVLGARPVTSLHTFAEHTIYAFSDEDGHNYYVRGFVVPLGLSEYVDAETKAMNFDQLEAPLRARLGEKSARSAPGNPRVLLACLPSLGRLRGQVTTRWYAPSYCPAAGR